MHLTTFVCAVTFTAVETPKSTLLVLNKEGILSIVDPASGQVVARVPTGEGPHEVTASTDGKLAFVSNYGAGTTLSVIDLVAQKELHRVDLGPLRRPHAVFYAEPQLYFTTAMHKLVHRRHP